MKASLILFPKISVRLKRLNVLGEYKKCIQHVIYSLLSVHLKRLIIMKFSNIFIFNKIMKLSNIFIFNKIIFLIIFFCESIMISFNMLIIINKW